ncbi:hypothetical protein Ancab_008579 [Ancistrocladus abbreviatus]
MSKSPKSAPSFRPAESRFGGENVSKPKVFHYAQKLKPKLAQQFRKNPPCIQKWQSGSKPSSNAGFKLKIQPGLRSKKGDFSRKSPYGAENLMQKKQENIALKSSQLTLPYNDNGGGAADITPLTKLASGSASASPKIQCGSSSLVSKTPACYGAGYVVFGVTDKTKCRPRGVLTVEDNYFLGFGKLKGCDNVVDHSTL